MQVVKHSERDAEKLLVSKIKKLGGRAYKFTSPGNAGVPRSLHLSCGSELT